MVYKNRQFTFVLVILLATMLNLLATPLMVLADERSSRVAAAIKEGKDYLMSLRRADGSWAGDLVLANRVTAYYVIDANYLGYFDHPYYDRALSFLIKTQNPDGSWGAMIGKSPPSLTTTAAAALALEMAGIPPSDPRLVRAHEFIVSHGGINAVDPLVQSLYALKGRADWDSQALSQFDLTALLVPHDSPASIRQRPAWWREGFVPVAMLRALHRKKALTLTERQGLRKAEEWLLSHQLSDGAWFTSIPTCFAVLVLHDMDPVRYRPQIEKAFKFFRTLQSPTGCQRHFELTVWDTSITLNALIDAGMPGCDPLLQSSIGWMASTQTPGALDLSECQPGGWSFNAHNMIYADCDDTSESLMAMARMQGETSHLEYRRRVAVQRATDWLWLMQGDDGGWATFMRDDDKDNDTKLPTGIDDWSIPDVTGHVLSSLGAVGMRADNERVQKAIEYLKRSQTDVGSWYGRWGLSYLYGTGAVLVGLRDVGADMTAPFVQKGANWLVTQQNTDGGWGEAFSSWDQSRGISYTKRSETSTREQTAWAVMGLLAAGHPVNDSVITRGIDYLLIPRKPKATFPDGDYTVLGIDPYTNSLYAYHWPLMALGMYQKALDAGKPKADDPCAVYSQVNQGLPETGTTGEAFGGAAKLSYSLTAEGPDEARLWVENKGDYQIKNLSISLSPEGASIDSGEKWSADSLKPGSKLSWRTSIPADADRVWNLQLSYSSPAGHPVQIERQLRLEHARYAGLQIGWIAWLLCVPLLVGLAWVARRSFKRYGPLISLGLNNLKKHRVRTALTSVGIIIGTAAIGATLTLSLAFREKLIKDFTTFGTNRLIVFPYNLEFKFGPPSSSLRRQPNTRFDKADVATVKALPQVTGASPFVQEDIVVAHNGQSLQMAVKFVDPETFPDVAASSVDSGRMLHKDSKREVVIGYAAAHDAYDVAVQTGDKLYIDGTEFEVIGIMAEVGGIRGRAGPIVSPDIEIYAPLDEATNLTGRNSYDGIELRTESAFSTEEVANQVEDMVKRRHVASEFSVITSDRLLGQVKNLLSQFTAIVLMIGLLTLIVSGIGVANMMLISIKERVEEIGIIKALGGRDRTVMMIFLSEAACIGIFSALFGSGLGYTLLLVLQWIAQVSVIPVAPYLLLFSLIFSLLITLGSGTYPAYVAARLDPAEAIRRA